MMRNFTRSLILLFCTFPIVGHTQTIQASIGMGSTANRAKIYLKSSSTMTSNNSTLEFNVGVLRSVSPKPTMTVISTVFPGVTWQVDTITEGDYYNYYITTATSPIQFPLVKDSIFEALEVEFSSPILSSTVALVTFPDGGSNGFLLFYATGSPLSDGSDLYFPMDGTTVDNKFSYTQGTRGGTDISTATIIQGALPIKLSNFTATKNNNDGILNWEVGYQDQNSSHFEIERSFTGSNFKNIGSVNILSTGQNYSFTDPNVAASHAGGVVYYRLKLMDKDGQFTYSDIKSLRLNAKTFALDLYPNPVENIANLNIDQDVANTLRIVISDAMGKQVRQMEFSGQKGLNRKTLDLSSLASGSYMIKVQSGDQVQTIPIIKK
jgi:hypothetical protein